MLNEEHWNVFQQCFPQPVQQGPVGRAPASYIKELPAEWRGPIPAENNPDLALNRDDLRNLWARNPDCSPLQAYAAVMAWGGRNFRNYRLSIAEDSIAPLAELLKYLRESNGAREEDFGYTQNAAKHIKGLGISFYTKLLYFFRNDPNAYILDQWAAKGVRLLFKQCPIKLMNNLPHPDLTASDYEWYCSALECLGRLISPNNPWSGTQVEQCLFDSRNGNWRNYVNNQFAADGVNFQEIRVQFANLLAAMTNAANYAGLNIPGNNFAIHGAGGAQPVRVSCGIVDRISWLFEINLNSVNAKAYISPQLLPELEDWLNYLAGLDVEVNINKSAAARIRIDRGANSPQSEWPAIAGKAISAMIDLYELWDE